MTCAPLTVLGGGYWRRRAGGDLPFPSKGFQVTSDIVNSRLRSSFHRIGQIKPIKHLIFVTKVGLFPAEAAAVMSPVTDCLMWLLMLFYFHGSSKSVPETPGPVVSGGTR